MQPIQKTSDFLGSLPLELFIRIIATSVSRVEPNVALRRLEQLRLVSKAWSVTINSAPQFWATIPNLNSKVARKIIKRWIKKSGEAPLHVISNHSAYPLESFMSLLEPLINRWKTLTICKKGWYPSAYLQRPAPLLESLTLVGAHFGPDTDLCAGVTPLLTRVDLNQVDLPGNLSFLKDLQELRLHLVTCMTKVLTIGQIYHILSASPNLRRLTLRVNLNSKLEEDAHHWPPLFLPSLETLLVCSPKGDRWTSGLLSIIDAPNIISMTTEFDDGPALRLFGSWLASQSPHQASPYTVLFKPTSVDVSILGEERSPDLSPRARLFLSHSSDEHGIRVLEEIDRLKAQTVPLALTIINPPSVANFMDYLKQPKVDQDGTQRLPLPTLRSVRFKVWSLVWSWNCIVSFAQVRTDVAEITIETVMPSGPNENMPSIIKTIEYLGPLPIELFTYILALSVSRFRPMGALARLEELRLVSKIWHITIDSTARFWATIPNHPRPVLRRITEWIRKSEETPLHITSIVCPLEAFMPLLQPSAHRWKTVTIGPVCEWDPSVYLYQPTPLLESITLLGAYFRPNAKLCAGVTPSLTRVDLVSVSLPRNPSFLKSLKELCLRHVTYGSKSLGIGQIYDILSGSPDLRRLELKLDVEDDTCHRPPFSFQGLEDLSVRCPEGPDRRKVNPLTIIDAPNLKNMEADFDRGPGLKLFRSWLVRQSLHQAVQYAVSIDHHWSLVVFKSGEEHGSKSSPHARLFLTEPTDDFGKELLEEIDRLGTLTAPLSLTIVNQDHVPACVDYLKQPKTDQEGVQRFPLPTLHSFSFTMLTLKFSWDWISSFAQVRKEVARIIVDTAVGSGLDEHVHTWNALNEGYFATCQTVGYIN
ncbi:hypothetical protein FS837_002705 [Tulasnella sp. UAMH 9824]|nr:hypothetical protein FS837_002705 [Tulasnella sp. UAMH 9824]